MRLDTFYYSPGACSLAAHAVLKLVDAPVAMHAIDTRAGEQRTPEYLKINRLGRVPALVVDGEPITELLAILLFLAERYPEVRLVPDNPIQRAKCYSWMSYLASTIHPFFGTMWRPYRFSDDTATHAAITSTGKIQLREEFAALDVHLKESTWLLGANKYVCDYFLFALSRWAPAVADVKKELPHIFTFLNRMAKEPAIERAMDAERVPLLRTGL